MLVEELLNIHWLVCALCFDSSRGWNGNEREYDIEGEGDINEHLKCP